MVYDHIVKFGGNFYAAGENVPDGAEEKKLPDYVDEKQEVAVEMPSPIIDDVLNETPQYTKSQISTMSTADLQSLADSVGIENAYETSGKDLKKILIDHFGL